MIYLQKRAHKAGAQGSLLRVISHERVLARHPVLVAGEEGWLTDRARSAGVEVVVLPFPSPRSLSARFGGVGRFARAVGGRVSARCPAVVHGNDLHEGLLTRAVATRLRVPSVLTLRSAHMSRRDFYKHGCDRHDVITAVGPELAKRSEGFLGRSVELIQNGVAESEWRAPAPVPAAFPARVLVIGSRAPSKGFGDVAAVLEGAKFDGVGFDFTDQSPDGWPATTSDIRFLGRLPNFVELVRKYALVVHPSHNESFGMAALEALYAGVPVLSSDVGVLPEVLPPEMRFPPQDCTALAERLAAIRDSWPAIPISVASCQATIAERYHIDRTVERYLAIYDRLRAAR